MYHSVNFGSKNSYSDWHLVPDSRPVIAMPEVKTNYIEVPGASGTLDMSESLTGYPVYNDRSGSMKFHVLNDYQEWQVLHQEIANYLHGKTIDISLEDDPNYYYTGRVVMAEWISNNNASTPWSDITFNYTLEPYKYWYDEFVKTKQSNVTNFSVDFSDESIGRMPEVPSFVVRNLGASGIDITLTNPELNINNRVRHISSNGTVIFYDLILSNISGNNECVMTLVGDGYAEVTYRRGDL